MSFTTVDKVKQLLGIPENVDKHDDVLTVIVEAVNCGLLDYLCLDAVEPTEYTLTTGVDSTMPLRLVRLETRPVISVTSVTLHDQLLDPEQYRLKNPNQGMLQFCDPSCVCRPRHALHRRGDGCRDLVVVVQAGFAPDDKRLKMICLGATQYAMSIFEGGSGTVKSKRIRNFSETKFTPAELGGLNTPAGWPATLNLAMGPFLWMASMTTATKAA